MTSSATTRNGFDKQGYGDNDDLWGINNLNTDLDLIDESLDGVTTITSTGGTYTLDATNYATNEARKRMLSCTGALVSTLILVAPNVQKWYVVRDATTGGGIVQIKTSAGVALTIPAGSESLVWCDGSATFRLIVSTSMNSRRLTNVANGTQNQDAVTVAQLASAVASASPLIGLFLYGNYW